ncbi:hypothetical protein JCM11641_003952 [Rhodosporidiobolus odoratus]
MGNAHIPHRASFTRTTGNGSDEKRLSSHTSSRVLDASQRRKSRYTRNISIFFVILSILVLVAWIIAAILLAHVRVRLFLPLNYLRTNAVSSAIVPVTYFDRAVNTTTSGTAYDKIDMPSNSSLAFYVAYQLNSFGSKGFPALQTSCASVHDPVKLSTIFVEVAKKNALARLSADLTAVVYKREGADYTTVNSKYTVQAYKHHLSGTGLGIGDEDIA